MKSYLYTAYLENHEETKLVTRRFSIISVMSVLTIRLFFS